MDILTIPFEDHLYVDLGHATVKIITFKTAEHGNVKFGVEAPKSVKVHREEIYNTIKEKERLLESSKQ